jgi:hypothetical protein
MLVSEAEHASGTKHEKPNGGRKVTEDEGDGQWQNRIGCDGMSVNHGTEGGEWPDDAKDDRNVNSAHKGGDDEQCSKDVFDTFHSDKSDDVFINVKPSR